MILQLKNGNIIIKDNHAPEDITNTKVSYEYELGTNHLVPKLYIDTKVYVGDNQYVSFDYKYNELDLHVDLTDGANNTIRSYYGTFPLYRTFTLGTQSHIDVYKELIKANEYIKELLEKGDII